MHLQLESVKLNHPQFDFSSGSSIYAFCHSQKEKIDKAKNQIKFLKHAIPFLCYYHCNDGSGKYTHFIH